MALRLRHRLLQRGMLAYGRFARGMTLGVRAILLKEDRVLLVRHSYLPGWYLPGGGVEAGETVADALRREIAEEAGASLTGPAELFGIYRNKEASSRDHVALFVCREWDFIDAPPRRSWEIVAAEMFPLGDLPEETTTATRFRIAEVLSAGTPTEDW
jgi:ADP-ribose pyrophosphatase YjhB (NUDIX family)